VAALAALAIRRSPIGRIGPALSCFVVLLLVVRSDVSDGADCSTGGGGDTTANAGRRALRNGGVPV